MFVFMANGDLLSLKNLLLVEELSGDRSSSNPGLTRICQEPEEFLQVRGSRLTPEKALWTDHGS